jgi:UDP-2,3-diacylglucosamine pyrophosphatase LpxH
VSNSESRASYPLAIESSDASVEFQVFDGAGVLVEQGTAPTTLMLPRGIYQVRVRAGSAVRDEMVRHTEASRIHVSAPRYVTPAPVRSASNAHAEHQARAVEWSARTTVAGAGAVPPTLFVFVRAAEGRGNDTPLGATLVLCDPYGTPIHPLDDPSAIQSGEGWVALALDLPPATYRLEDRRDGGRAMPVAVAAGWCTQVFVWFDGKPRLEHTRGFMASIGRPFEPDGAIERAMDRGLEALQSGSELPERDLSLLLSEKFENPMQGLLACYLLLARDAEPRQLDNIVGHLRALIPGSPDVEALTLAVALRLRRPWSGPRFSAPPMLRAGFTAVQQWAAEHEDLVDEPLFDIADSLLGDSPWTQWELEDVQATETASPQLERTSDNSGPRMRQLDLAVLQRLVFPRRPSTPGSAIVSTDPAAIARDLGQSPRAVARAIHRVREAATRQGRRIEELFEKLVRGEIASDSPPAPVPSRDGPGHLEAASARVGDAAKLGDRPNGGGVHRAFIVSDLHLGGDVGFQMCPPRNQAALASLIESLTAQHSPSTNVHFVIAGDIVDFLAETPHASFTAASRAAREKLERIFERTTVVWDALQNLVRRGCRLTLMLGNHDIELALPEVAASLFARLGADPHGDAVTLRADGEPLRLGSTIVMHGNASDAWNHVPYRRLDDFARGDLKAQDELSIPGSELVARVMNPIKADHPWIDLLKPETSALLPLLAVLRPSTILQIPVLAKLYLQSRRRALGRAIDADDIATDIPASVEAHLDLARELAGATDEIGAGELYEAGARLWRGAANAARAGLRRRFRRALGALSQASYFDTSREERTWLEGAEAALAKHSAATVVFGHTHAAKRLAVSRGTYLNTGTWADLLALPPETWAVRATDEQERAFDVFIDDLVNNTIEARRRLIPTYVHVDHGESTSKAELYFADGLRVPDGNVMETAG